MQAGGMQAGLRQGGEVQAGAVQAGLPSAGSRCKDQQTCAQGTAAAADLALCPTIAFVHPPALPNQQTPRYGCHGNQKRLCVVPGAESVFPGLGRQSSCRGEQLSGWLGLCGQPVPGWCRDLPHQPLASPAEGRCSQGTERCCLSVLVPWGLAGTKNSHTAQGVLLLPPLLWLFGHCTFLCVPEHCGAAGGAGEGQRVLGLAMGGLG